MIVGTRLYAISLLTGIVQRITLDGILYFARLAPGSRQALWLISSKLQDSFVTQPQQAGTGTRYLWVWGYTSTSYVRFSRTVLPVVAVVLGDGALTSPSE